MTPVLMQFLTSTGEPLAFASVDIQLTRSTFTEDVEGVVMPRLVQAKTGLDGKALVHLMPSNEHYHVSAYDTLTDIGVHYHFYVPYLNNPDTVVRLQDLIVEDDARLSDMAYDEVALQRILDAKVNTIAARDEAVAAADYAAEAVQFADDSIAVTQAARDVAVAASVTATEARDVILPNVDKTYNNALLAEDRAAVALQARADAVVKASEALQSAIDAATEADAAALSANEAQASEDTAIAARDVATSASTTAVSAKDEAVSARDITVAARDVTTAARDTAVQKATQLSSQLFAFNEIYLGKFAAHPTVDGNGNTLKVGAIYENTVEGKIYQWESDLAWHPYDEESQAQLNSAILSANNAAASAGAALASQTAAEDARADAEMFKNVAGGYAEGAASDASDALVSKNIATGAADTAVGAADTATTKAGEAAQSAADAADYLAQAQAGQVQADWLEADIDNKGFIKNKPAVWHADNDGAGSGLDADLLGGASTSTTSSSNTIAKRDSVGSIGMHYANCTYVSTSHAQTTRNTDTIFYSSTDNFVRKNTAAGFKSSLALNNVENKSAATILGELTGASILTKVGATTLTGSNTGDETTASIKSKLGITTLSGSNTGDQTAASLGLGNVNNTSDLNKPISTATQAALDLKANITYVDQKVADLVAATPGALDTLDELAAALGDDPNFATTMTTALGNRAKLDSGNTFYGKQIASLQYQTNYGSAALEAHSPNGDVHISLHSAGSSATSIKHVRGSSGIEVVGEDGTSRVPVKAGSFIATNGVEASGLMGFGSSTYAIGTRNPIWRFMNSPSYGFSYFQGTAGNAGQDTIGFHFGDASVSGSGSQFGIRGDGWIFAKGRAVVGGVQTTGGGDLTMQSGPAEDCGDIVWLYNSGQEKHRIFETAAGTGLQYRNNAGAAHELIHGGNVSTHHANSANRLYASNNTTYQYGGTNPYYMTMEWNGSRWRLAAYPATPSSISVAHATDADNATNLNGVAASHTMQKRTYAYNNGGPSLDGITQAEYGFAYPGQGNNSGPFIHFGGLNQAANYSCQLSANYGPTMSLKFRTKNDDDVAGGFPWNPWRELWHDQNLNPQESAVGYSVVKRSQWGYVFGNYINMTDDGMSSNSNNVAVTGIITKKGDNYYRHATAAQVKSFLGYHGAEIRTDRLDKGTFVGHAWELSWKNYGNGHTIFDASAGTAPNGTAINNTNPQNNWTGTYPTLMGWNGANTYGVRVDSARNADFLNGLACPQQSPTGYGKNWPYIPYVAEGGVLEIGRYLDFHVNSGETGTDFGLRVEYNGNRLLSQGYEIVLNDGGSWGINVTGTATYARQLTGGNYRWSADANPNQFGVGIEHTFVGAGESQYPHYGGLIHFRPYSGHGGGSMQILTPYGDGNGGTDIKVRLANHISNTVWGGWATFVTSFNIGNYTAGAANRLYGPAYVNGSDGWFRSQNQCGWFNETYSVGIWATEAGMVRTYNGASFTANNVYANDVTITSDERLKTNWRPVTENFVQKWSEVRSGIYDRTDIERTQAGLGAQSVQEVLPEVVSETDGHLTLSYGAAAAVATVELAKEMMEMKATINALMQRIKELEAK